MDSCSKCGKELSETGVCSCEQATDTATADQIPSNTASINDDCLNVLKKTFSSKPDNAVTEAINSKKHIWAVFGGIYVLLSSFAMMWIFESLVKASLRAILGQAGNMASGILKEIMPYGGLFGTGLLLAAISLAVLSGCIKVLYVIFKQDVSFATVMNLVSSSLLIMSASMLAAIIFSFSFFQFSIMLIAVGAVGSLIMLHNGIQKAAPFSISPLWAFLGINAVNIIVVFLIGEQLLSSVIGEAIGKLLGSTSWLW